MNSIAERAREARAKAQNVPSPCISVCTMNAAGGWCNGCLRTLDEIAAWSVMTDQDKRQVWTLIEARAAATLP